MTIKFFTEKNGKTFFTVFNRVNQPIFVSYHSYGQLSDAKRAAKNMTKYLHGNVRIVE